MAALDRRSFLKTTAAAGLIPFPAGASVTKPGDDDPLGVRADFPVTRDRAYLNTSSVGPIPRAVRDALVAYADEKMLQRDPGSRQEALARTRKSFAELFGADEEEIAFLYSTSDAENIIVEALEWKAGDNVVLDELHFTTSFVLYRELEKKKGVELRIVKQRDGRGRIEDFEARTDERTRLISVAWVSNRNGFRYDLPALTELAHAHGAYSYADAIQAFGHFPTSLHEERVDFACGNGYKWLHADFGCAPFYVRKEHLEWLHPDRYGHRHVQEELPDHYFRLKTTAAKYEYANPTYGAIVALEAALGYLKQVGLARIEKHTVALAAELRAGADELGFDVFTPEHNPSPIVSFFHGIDPNVLAEALKRDSVDVTLRERGELLRAGVAMFNNRNDVDRLLRVLSKMA